MEVALAEFSQGRVLQPVRQMLTIEEEKRYLGIMPAVAAEAMGLKLVSFYPGNAGTGVPTHMAMILLLPPMAAPLAKCTGLAFGPLFIAPVFVLLSAPEITSMPQRTAAAIHIPVRRRPSPALTECGWFA